MRTLLTYTTLLCFTIIAGCEDTGIRTGGHDGGVCDPASFDDDFSYVDCVKSGTPAPFSYTPESCSHEVSTPSVYRAAMSGVTFGEDPAPKGVHSSFAGPATTSFAASWTTDLRTDRTIMLYGTSESDVTGAEGATGSVSQQLGHVMAYATLGSGVKTAHEVHTCGLTADTIYYYKVGGPGHWSPVYEYRTAPATGTASAWKFAISGDSRTPTENRWAKSQRALSMLSTPVRLQVFSGDAVLLGSNQPEWDAFFTSSEQGFSVDQLLASVPFMVTNGNHDGLAINYVAQFALPQTVSPGELGTGEEWYSFDYGNAHFVVLNDTVMSNQIISNEERAWLQADLAAVDRNVTPWVFVTHHRPIHTCLSNHQPDTAVRSAWQPLFDQFNVDIVFAGHNHVYERSRPIRGLDSGNNAIVAAQGGNSVPTIAGGIPSGTLYVVSAGVGAELYEVSETCAFTARAESVSNYTLVTLTGRTISVEVIDYTTGNMIDAFTYTK